MPSGKRDRKKKRENISEKHTGYLTDEGGFRDMEQGESDSEDDIDSSLNDEDEYRGRNTSIHKHYHSVLNFGAFEGLETTDEFYKGPSVRNTCKIGCGCIAWIFIYACFIFIIATIVIVVNK